MYLGTMSWLISFVLTQSKLSFDGRKASENNIMKNPYPECNSNPQPYDYELSQRYIHMTLLKIRL